MLGAVETLPHATFRAAWVQQSFNIATIATSSSIRRDDIETDELVRIIRVILNSAAALAQSYDVGSAARYAANVMFFVPNLGKAPYFEAELWRVVRFRPRWSDERLDLIDGILILKKELSALAAGPEADDRLQDIGFIVQKAPLSNKWWILPGAPRAFAKGLVEQKYAAHGYSDVSKIDLLNKEDFSIDNDIVAEVKKYYSEGEGKSVKSFVALTIPRLQDPLADPLGVLNIHSDAVAMLGGDNERYKIFAQLMAPFVSELAWAAELWANKTKLRI